MWACMQSRTYACCMYVSVCIGINPGVGGRDPSDFGMGIVEGSQSAAMQARISRCADEAVEPGLPKMSQVREGPTINMLP